MEDRPASLGVAQVDQARAEEIWALADSGMREISQE